MFNNFTWARALVLLNNRIRIVLVNYWVTCWLLNLLPWIGVASQFYLHISFSLCVVYRIFRWHSWLSRCIVYLAWNKRYDSKPWKGSFRKVGGVSWHTTCVIITGRKMRYNIHLVIYTQGRAWCKRGIIRGIQYMILILLVIKFLRWPATVLIGNRLRSIADYIITQSFLILIFELTWTSLGFTLCHTGVMIILNRRYVSIPFTARQSIGCFRQDEVRVYFLHFLSLWSLTMSNNINWINTLLHSR